MQPGWWWLMVAAAAALAHLPPAHSQLIELSYTFNEDAPFPPSSLVPRFSPFVHSVRKKGQNKHGIWVEEFDISASEHSGTHVDAPKHYNRNGSSVAAIPLQRLWRVPGVVVDVQGAIQRTQNRNYEVRAKDLDAWETKHGVIPDGALVLVRTGWGRKVADVRSYSGLDQHNKLNFPGLGKEAAEWLVQHGTKHKQETGVVGVGVDTFSLDVGQSVRMPAHVALSAAGVYGLENLKNLDKLPLKDFYVTVMPMNIGGGSGAPARVVAEVGEVAGLHCVPSAAAPLLAPLLLATPLLLLLTAAL